jgi:hypothetical protein
MTDLNSIKKEIGKLTDLDYLKAELNRIAVEIKKFDVHVSLTPQTKDKLDQLEKRFRDVLKTINQMQSQVDREIVKFMKVVKKTRLDAEKKLRSSVGLGKKKVSPKTTTAAAPAATKKVRKAAASSKKATAKKVGAARKSTKKAAK